MIYHITRVFHGTQSLGRPRSWSNWNEMGNKLRDVVKLATTIFRQSLRAQHHVELSDQSHPLSANFRSLQDEVSSLSVSDINFDFELVSDTTPYTSSYHLPNTIAPACYIDILENSEFTLGVFILRNGYTMPLHNHPDMYGILKVIHGCAGVESFTVHDSKQHEEFIKLGDVELSNQDFSDLVDQGLILLSNQPSYTEASAEDNALVLSPTKANIHRITALGGPLAFFDILGPPYDHSTNSRVCTFYEEAESNLQDLCVLRKIPPPHSYWTKSAPYLGPKLDNLL